MSTCICYLYVYLILYAHYVIRSTRVASCRIDASQLYAAQSVMKASQYRLSQLGGDVVT